MICRLTINEETIFEKDVFLKKPMNELALLKKTMNNGLCTTTINEWSTNYCTAIHIRISRDLNANLTFESGKDFAVLCFAVTGLVITQEGDAPRYTLQSRTNVLVYNKNVEAFFQEAKMQFGEAFFLIFSQDFVASTCMLNPVIGKTLKKEYHFAGCVNPLYCTFETTLEADFIICQIKGLKKTGELSSFILENKARELLSILLLQKEKEKCMGCNCYQHYKHQIYAAKDHLEAQYQNPPTIKQLAQEVGLSETILKTGFKSFFGTTVYNYLFDYRMQIASHMLMETSFQINEIAEFSGYEYQSHFTTAFKRKFEVTPVEYRKKMA